MIAFILDLYVTQISSKHRLSVGPYEGAGKKGYENVDVDSDQLNNKFSMEGISKQDKWEILEEKKSSFSEENKSKLNQYVQLSPTSTSKNKVENAFLIDKTNEKDGL